MGEIAGAAATSFDCPEWKPSMSSGTNAVLVLELVPEYGVGETNELILKSLAVCREGDTTVLALEPLSVIVDGEISTAAVAGDTPTASRRLCVRCSARAQSTLSPSEVADTAALIDSPRLAQQWVSLISSEAAGVRVFELLPVVSGDEIVAAAAATAATEGDPAAGVMRFCIRDKS